MNIEINGNGGELVIGKTRTFNLIELNIDDSGLITYDIAEDWYM